MVLVFSAIESVSFGLRTYGFMGNFVMYFMGVLIPYSFNPTNRCSTTFYSAWLAVS